MFAHNSGRNNQQRRAQRLVTFRSAFLGGGFRFADEQILFHRVGQHFARDATQHHEAPGCEAPMVWSTHGGFQQLRELRGIGGGLYELAWRGASEEGSAYVHGACFRE